MKDLETKILAKCHDLYVQSNTHFLADVFNSSQNMCLNPTDFFLHQDQHGKPF